MKSPELNTQEVSNMNQSEMVAGTTEQTPDSVLQARAVFDTWDAENFGETPEEIFVDSPELIPKDAIEAWNNQHRAD